MFPTSYIAASFTPSFLSNLYGLFLFMTISSNWRSGWLQIDKQSGGRVIKVTSRCDDCIYTVSIVPLEYQITLPSSLAEELRRLASDGTPVRALGLCLWSDDTYNISYEACVFNGTNLAHPVISFELDDLGSGISAQQFASILSALLSNEPLGALQDGDSELYAKYDLDADAREMRQALTRKQVMTVFLTPLGEGDKLAADAAARPAAETTPTGRSALQNVAAAAQGVPVDPRVAQVGDLIELMPKEYRDKPSAVLAVVAGKFRVPPEEAQGLIDQYNTPHWPPLLVSRRML
jgi:hypothetical protein